MSVLIKGSFTNYVDKILSFLDHLPPCVDIFYGKYKRWQKVDIFGPTKYQARLVTIVCERPLKSKLIWNVKWNNLSYRNSWRISLPPNSDRNSWKIQWSAIYFRHEFFKNSDCINFTCGWKPIRIPVRKASDFTK